jgi:CRISP-associated protein Cas1
MKNIYITQSGEILRKDNSLIFKNENLRKTIPIKEIDSIYILSEVTLNTKFLNFISQNHISIFFYNYYGYYSGVFAPREKNVSGNLLVQQVQHYQDINQRLFIAKEFLFSALHNMRKTLMQYNLKESSEKILEYELKLKTALTVNKLMLVEANLREFYYKQFNTIINNESFKFIKRIRNPPDNYINTLISFGNSLLYTTILSEIFKTQLNPTISYLHEPFTRRYSLNLDLAEIFKPLIVDRVIFSLINRKQILPEHFDLELNLCLLNEKGRALFLREYDNKLNSTLKYPSLNRKVSYRYMFRLECYKLIKYLLENKEYKGFKIYW